MLILLLFLFVLLVLLGFLEDRLTDLQRQTALIGVVTLMALVAGLRPDDLDNDYSNYVKLYNMRFTLTTEVTFVFIVSLIQATLDEIVLLFLVYAILALTLHGVAIRHVTHLCFLTLLMYWGSYYLLHGMNQIRVGVAAGFFLLSLPYLRTHERGKYCLLALCATLFHYSAGILFLLAFFDSRPMKRWQYWFYGSILPVSYLLYLAQVNLLTMVPIPYFEEKMKAYQALQSEGVGLEINVFNLVLLAKIAITGVLFWKSKLIYRYNRYVPILLKIEILSLASFVLFYELPVLAFRICELLGIVEIVLFPLLYYTVRPSWVGKSVVCVVALVLFFIGVFYNQVIFL